MAWISDGRLMYVLRGEMNEEGRGGESSNARMRGCATTRLWGEVTLTGR